MNMAAVAEFLLELDRLKMVNRRTSINGGERLENSAEHSWHLALACWLFAGHFGENLNVEKLIKMALIHDLGEIDAGDTFLYDVDRNQAVVKEREGILRLAHLPGNLIGDFVALWDEQESGASREAKILKVIDRLLPFLHNISSGGAAWKTHKITASQVLSAHYFLQLEAPEIYGWQIEKLNYAVQQGWLIDG